MTKPNCVCCIWTRHSCPPKSGFRVSAKTSISSTAWSTGISVQNHAAVLKYVHPNCNEKAEDQSTKEKTKAQDHWDEGLQTFSAGTFQNPTTSNLQLEEKIQYLTMNSVFPGLALFSLVWTSHATRCLEHRVTKFHLSKGTEYEGFSKGNLSPTSKYSEKLRSPLTQLTQLTPGRCTTSAPGPHARSIWHYERQCHGRPGPLAQLVAWRNGQTLDSYQRIDQH